ncbi:UPF0481 protein At3g47200-like [Solanum stenotomum]|uniref:UPF0481 protein At3g47200-like n=1 Tax=Solanum stenotomum TaxID=172797 RepID=UPI0020D0D470|nr:UPF0481 protein At3g47200-like [Solanum stenotomum]
MAHSIEITSIDNQTPLLLQTEKDEIKETNDEDPSGSQTKKRVNQIFDKMFDDLDKSSFKSNSIFKVNVRLRESNPDAYTPKMVSIGPYHRKNPQLRPMEKYKLLYLRRFLKRKEGLDVEFCTSELQILKEEALKCYEDIEDNSHEFCQMLLLDGCFVVEFIRERWYEVEQLPKEKDMIIITNDASYIFRDLMLLENQLPFFVLDQLYHLTKQDYESPLAVLVNNAFTRFVDTLKIFRASFRLIGSITGDIKHLLHLVHILLCDGNPPKNVDHHITYHKVMPNAIELSEAGVSFVDVSSDTTKLLDIKFVNGLMRIPCFRVEHGTETLLRNLIAYEQQSNVHPSYFSDYAIFMDHLIDSDKDVNLLRQKGIIVNCIADDKSVASLFNKIGNGVVPTYPNFYYDLEFRQAIEYSEKPWNRMKANLKHNYFSSPWVGASTMTAIILLLLTTIQTILAITSAFKSNNYSPFDHRDIQLEYKYMDEYEEEGEEQKEDECGKEEYEEEETEKLPKELLEYQELR